MKIIETNTYELPISYGSALINDDYSGLDEVEIKELNEWVDINKPGYCVDVSEESFPTRFNGLLTECSTYTFHKYE